MKPIQNTKPKYRYFFLSTCHLLYRTEGIVRHECIMTRDCSGHRGCHQNRQEWYAECTNYPANKAAWFKARNGCFKLGEEILGDPFEVKDETH